MQGRCLNKNSQNFYNFWELLSHRWNIFCESQSNLYSQIKDLKEENMMNGILSMLRCTISCSVL